MNGKPSEHLDQWVRHTLDRLPDVPPPGSGFDADRLWGQLRPELDKAPAHRRVGFVGWAAAACFLILALGGFWLTPPVRRITTVTHRSVPALTRSATPTNSTHKPLWGQLANYKLGSKRHPGSRPRAILKPDPPVQLNELPEPPDSPTAPVAVIAPLVEPANEPTKTALVATVPKRRFRVMHVNELAAEEETRPKIYHTESVVRLGTGTGQKSANDESAPAIIIPLTRKPNH